MSAVKKNIAIVGATGIVGAEILRLLSESELSFGEVHALASSDSIGREVSFGDVEILKVQSAEHFDFAKVDIAIFATDAHISKILVPKAKKAGCISIDSSSAFRMDPAVPLVIPEINASEIAKHQKIIASPNCLITQVSMLLAPLLELSLIKRVVISSYQSVSGVGKAAMDELFSQVKQILTYQDTSRKVFSKQIAFNILPKIDDFCESGYTKEEEKVIQEGRKILNSDLKITATCVRVPIFTSHSASVNVEFSQQIDIKEIYKKLSSSKGLIVTDEKNKENYATPIECTGESEVFISRIRKDESAENSFNFWVVSDNLRKGAALNVIQILEELTKNYL